MTLLSLYLRGSDFNPGIWWHWLVGFGLLAIAVWANSGKSDK